MGNNTANETWLETIRQLLNVEVPFQAKRKGTTGQMHRVTQEIIPYHSVIDMHYPVVSANVRALNYRFMFAEALWILRGSDLVSDLEPYCKGIGKWISDDGFRSPGAYGPRILAQLAYVVQLLQREPESRQAVISTWQANPAASCDIPCTLSTQFLIRNGKLDLIHTMRSSDIWMGWPYDIFSFAMLALNVIIRLRPEQDLDLGSIYFTAGSQHLYEDNKPKAILCYHDQSSLNYKPLEVGMFKMVDDQMAFLADMRRYRPMKHVWMQEVNEYHVALKNTNRTPL